MIKTINTGVAELLCVKVPENSYRHLFTNIHGDNDLVFYIKNEFPKFVTLPDGNYQLLGIAHELTEEAWRQVLTTVSEWSEPLYRNYMAKCSDYRDIVDSAFDTATESGLSLLRANEVYSVNPYEKKPNEFYEYIDSNTGKREFLGEGKYHDDRLFDKAQETTGKWVMLKKIEEV